MKREDKSSGENVVSLWWENKGKEETWGRLMMYKKWKVMKRRDKVYYGFFFISLLGGWRR